MKELETVPRRQHTFRTIRSLEYNFGMAQWQALNHSCKKVPTLQIFGIWVGRRWEILKAASFPLWASAEGASQPTRGALSTFRAHCSAGLLWSSTKPQLYKPALPRHTAMEWREQGGCLTGWPLTEPARIKEPWWGEAIRQCCLFILLPPPHTGSFFFVVCFFPLPKPPPSERSLWSTWGTAPLP